MHDPYYNGHLRVLGAQRAQKTRKVATWTADRFAQQSEEHTKMVNNGQFATANDFGGC
jgi:hypothetical protein